MPARRSIVKGQWSLLHQYDAMSYYFLVFSFICAFFMVQDRPGSCQAMKMWLAHKNIWPLMAELKFSHRLWLKNYIRLSNDVSLVKISLEMAWYLPQVCIGLD